MPRWINGWRKTGKPEPVDKPQTEKAKKYRRYAPYGAGLVLLLAATAYWHGVLEYLNVVVVASATFAIAYFTRELSRATAAIDEGGRRTLGHLEKTSERDLRAYLGVRALPMDEYLKRHQTPKWVIDIHNFGKTPAHHVQTWLTASISKCPHPAGFAFMDDPIGAPSIGIVVHPGDSRPHALESPDLAANFLKQARMSGDPSIALCIHGVVRYADIQGETHYSRFCYFYSGPTGNLTACFVHNTAD